MEVLSRRSFGCALAAAALWPLRARAEPDPALKTVDVGGGITLHYVEAGRGEPVIFVHGSLSDYSYWSDQLGPFSQHVRAIAYSRRYNFPNRNPARPGYSAVADATDLAGLIERLNLGPAHIVGHSYGAFTALFLAVRRPELVKTLTLAEAPAVSLLNHVPPPDSQTGKAMLADLYARLVRPMQAAFRAGRSEDGVRIFIDYVMNRPGAWASFSPDARAETMRNVQEWNVMLTDGVLFPDLPLASVRGIRRPALLLSGAKSYPFLGMIDKALMALLPERRRIVFPQAGHQMWFQQPVACRDAVLALVSGRQALAG